MSRPMEAIVSLLLIFFCTAAKSTDDKILPCTSAADCGDGDPCTIETCAPDGFCAWTEVFCPVSPRHAGNPCFYGKCTNSSAGTALCVTLDDICDDGDECTLDRCDRYTGACSHQQKNCRDSDFCTIDYCDGKLGCLHEQASCDDGDACTDDSCDPKFGCAHVRRSCSVSVHSPAYNACRISECDPASGECVERDREYERENSPCFVTECDPRRGWFDEPVCDIGRGEICQISSEESGAIICVPPHCQREGDCISSDYFCCSGNCVQISQNDFARECCEATDCRDPEYDMCCEGKCIPDAECCGLSDCEPYGAICDLDIHECFSCETHADCELAYGPGKKCDSESRECRDPLCARDSDCLDGDACTVDACNVEEGACIHEPRPWECECHDSSDCEILSGACLFCDRGRCRDIATCDDGDPSTQGSFVFFTKHGKFSDIAKITKISRPENARTKPCDRWVSRRCVLRRRRSSFWAIKIRSPNGNPDGERASPSSSSAEGSRK